MSSIKGWDYPAETDYEERERREQYEADKADEWYEDYRLSH